MPYTLTYGPRVHPGGNAVAGKKYSSIAGMTGACSPPSHIDHLGRRTHRDSVSVQRTGVSAPNVVEDNNLCVQFRSKVN